MFSYKRRSIFLSILSISLAAGLFYCIFTKPKDKPIPVEDVFSQAPWSKPLPYLPPLAGVGEVRAENCGKCHVEIYAEWKTSTHANALSDLQFQSELSKPSSPRWLCLNCHTPVANQRETLVDYLNNGDYRSPIEEPNPKFDPKMKEEAVTCAVCHVRLDENGNSYILGANGKTKPPHPVKIVPDQLRNRCLDCHNANYILDDQLVCAFNTGIELEQKENSHGKLACGSCHMRELQRKLVKPELNTPIRTSHKHSFIGGGVPKKFELYEKQIPGGYRSGLTIEPILWKKKGNDLEYSVSLKNEKAAHNIPTGDPERFLLLKISILDPEGRSLADKEIKFGQEWEWYPKAKLVADTRILPGETKVWKDLFTGIEKGYSKIVFEIYHIRLKESNAEHMRKNSEKVKSYQLRKKISEIENHYPFSSLVHKEAVDLNSGKSRIYSPEEVFRISKNRRGE
ncbi:MULTISPECIES: multiheme c-type cytochrome [unclassified Leptospira]|uniref:multiheme c-type cytochrome n=1 Tax=unclassified Leptospira TaxID=2633828 RepID=UPI0002BEA4C0|nr:MULTISPECIES: multiheme c-type cytochrome [unclassified Leptospira]EMK00828.1 cytochrome c554 and C-prime [Leptospira sp. B5-022]MCR1794188.1 cytochrome c family protein [Leptospira sp. id769339]